jgi:hypothetical protein
VFFCNEYIVLNVPSKIVCSRPINKKVDRWVGRKFRILGIKTAYIVHHYNDFTHLSHIPFNSSKLIDNWCVVSLGIPDEFIFLHVLATTLGIDCPVSI